MANVLSNDSEYRRDVVSLPRADGALCTVGSQEERQRISLLKIAILLADLVVVCVAMALAFRLRLHLPGPDPRAVHGRHLALAAVSLPIWLGMFVHYRLYRANQVMSRREELGRLLHGVAASVAAMALIGFMAKVYVARGWLVLTFVVAVSLLAMEREVIRRILTAMRRNRRLLRRVIIAGANRDGIALCRSLAADPSLGYEVVGFVDDNPSVATGAADRPVLGPLGDIRDILRATGAQGVIVVATAVGAASANQLARELPDVGVRVEIIVALRDIALPRLSLRSLGSFPVLHIERVRRRGWRAVAKRTFDVAVAGAGLIVFAPVMVAAGAAVKLTSRGPVLFHQKRLGRDGHLFQILKFRTMVLNAETRVVALQQRNEADGPLFKIHNDPRVTPVGRVLRRFSIDELPQLWNVLRGEMAMVGPRPALPTETSGWSPQLHQRLRVKPGITGMWQVGGRSQASFEEYTRLDLYYVDNWSLAVDLMIMGKTLPAVLSRRGAC